MEDYERLIEEGLVCPKCEEYIADDPDHSCPFILTYHGPKCCGQKPLPHEAGHRSEHQTLEEAVQAVPEGTNGYIDWETKGRVFVDGRDRSCRRV